MRTQRYPMLFILGVILVFLGGCAHCPSQDIITVVPTPYGAVVISIEKGTFDKENHGTHWMTLEEWYEQLKKQEPKEDKDSECS